MTKTYGETVTEWRIERDLGIRKENGWLSLAGLFWLKLGRNRLGSDPRSEINLPDRASASIGTIEYNGKAVTLRTEKGLKVDVNGTPSDFAVLQPDVSDNPSYITFNDLRLVVIQRGNRMGMRMWDNAREERVKFPPRIWYEIDEGFRLPAKYTAYPRPKTAFFPDLSGEKTESTVDGYLEFQYKGKTYRLDVTKEEENELFVRFWDPTTESETYPTGRYLVVNLEKNNSAWIDFNYAYCPPCAFTDFATCVFAPEQNHLDFNVTAGEKYERHD
jgi:uncharacterized protein